jgi:hypothetical protein
MILSSQWRCATVKTSIYSRFAPVNRFWVTYSFRIETGEVYEKDMKQMTGKFLDEWVKNWYTQQKRMEKWHRFKGGGKG